MLCLHFDVYQFYTLGLKIIVTVSFIS